MTGVDNRPVGFGMATHLVKQDYLVRGFDVFHGSREKFEAAGGIPTTSLAKSAEGCLYYVCMVATAQQAQGALFDPKDSIVQCRQQGFHEMTQSIMTLADSL